MFQIFGKSLESFARKWRKQTHRHFLHFILVPVQGHNDFDGCCKIFRVIEIIFYSVVKYSIRKYPCHPDNWMIKLPVKNPHQLLSLVEVVYLTLYNVYCCALFRN